MIKSILVPTDFSACAMHALRAGALFAAQGAATVRILHVTEMAGIESLDFPAQAEAYAKMETLLHELKAQVPGGTVVSDIRSGPLIRAVQSVVSDYGVDLVVMGSHGASGKNEYFIGSNTQKVVRAVHCPVLVVKEPIEALHFDKVVFASDFQREEESAFLRFKEMVKHFTPEIHLLLVHTASIFEPSEAKGAEAMAYFSRLCAPLTVRCHQYSDFNVDQGVRVFAQKLGASLIGVSNRQRHPLRRMLTGSTVDALINHAALPVLCIDFED